jgi:phosphoribosylformimino-5-aminoimidazole carboxamide ribotide isomerase
VTVVPALDLRAGRVVRLKRGELRELLEYGANPAEAARRWQDLGAARLHVVDLDAAIERRSQASLIAEVIRAVTIPVEVGGGVRTFEDAQRYREAGAERVIFGTAAVASPEVVRRALAEWPGSIAVALDARRGKVAVAGWQEVTQVDVLELARDVRAWGVPRIQYTDVVRDGTLGGPNLAATEELARACGLRITAAGGVATLDDLRALVRLESLGVDEVVVGKALYEGRFTLAEAQAVASGHA